MLLKPERRKYQPRTELHTSDKKLEEEITMPTFLQILQSVW
jgi:hypothetical protein